MTSLGKKLRDGQARPAVVILVGTFLYTLWHVFGRPQFYIAHHGSFSFTGNEVIDAGLYWAAMNLLLVAILLYLVRGVFGGRLADYGLGKGKVGFGISRLVLATPIVIGIGYLVSTQESFRDYYPIYRDIKENQELLGEA